MSGKLIKASSKHSSSSGEDFGGTHEVPWFVRLRCGLYCLIQVVDGAWCYNRWYGRQGSVDCHLKMQIVADDVMYVLFHHLWLMC